MNTKSPKLEKKMEFAPRSMIYFLENVTSHNLLKKFLNFLPLLLKNLSQLQSKTNKKKLYMGNITRRKWLESSEYEFLYHRVGFQRIFAALSIHYDQFLHKFFARASEFGRTMRGSNFREFLPINVPNRYRGEIYDDMLFYDYKLSKTTEAYYLEPGLYSSITDIAEAMNTLIQERNNHRETCITIKVSRVTQKLKVYLANEELSLETLSTDLRRISGGDIRNDLGRLMRVRFRRNQPLHTIMFASIHSWFTLTL